MLEQYELLVEETLENIFKVTKTDDEKLNSVIRKYFLAGGKRIRVLLVLICSRLGDLSRYKKDVITVASIVEIIHTASLIHDDIIDKAETRRGEITLNKKYDDRYALYVGDYLFAKSLGLAATIEDSRLHDYLATTLKELCIGEIFQEQNLYNVDSRTIDYLKKIKRKTAVLISFASVGGAIASRASDDKIRASYLYGYYLGMSYQIVDDYLDYVGVNIGKEVGQDLVNGNITLPAIIAYKKNKDLFNNYNENSTLKEKQQIIDFIKNDKNVLEETLDISNRYLAKAKNVIKNIDKEIESELMFVIDMLSRRDK